MQESKIIIYAGSGRVSESQPRIQNELVLFHARQIGLAQQRPQLRDGACYDLPRDVLRPHENPTALMRSYNFRHGGIRGPRSVVDKIGPAFKRLPEIASQFQDAVTKANRLIGSVDQGYGSSSKFHRDLDRLIPQLTDTARSIRALADLLSRHPEALIKGRTNTGKE